MSFLILKEADLLTEAAPGSGLAPGLLREFLLMIEAGAGAEAGAVLCGDTDSLSEETRGGGLTEDNMTSSSAILVMGIVTVVGGARLAVVIILTSSSFSELTRDGGRRPRRCAGEAFSLVRTRSKEAAGGCLL